MKNIKLQIAYDGTEYLGWQKTKMGPSIEAALEEALQKILRHEVTLQAASRTDAGVHAAGQIVNFFTQKNLPLEKLKHSLNCVLPRDIAVDMIEQARDTFHPTLDCIGKEYHYQLCYGQVQHPFQRFYSWHYPYPLDLQKIRETIPLLLGKHDFSAFCNAKKNSTYDHHIRDLETILLVEEPQDCLRFIIRGNNFLYKMVRNLIGTLVYAGCGKIEVKEVAKILSRKDRTQAGMTAPAHGLCLHRVLYSPL